MDRCPTPDEVRSALGLFGLGADCSRDQIVAAWKDALRLTHPDLAREGTRDIAEQLSKRVNEAKEILVAEWERRRHERRPATPGMSPVPSDLGWWGVRAQAPRPT